MALSQKLFPISKKVKKLAQIDGVDGFYAKGWVFDKSSPDYQPVIQIVCEGKIIGEGPANQYRPDLHSSGFGDGNHGYSIALDKAVFDGKRKELTIVDRDHGASLPANEFSIGDPAEASVRIVSVNGNSVSGIVKSKSRAISEDNMVCVFVDDELAGSGPCIATTRRTEFRFYVTLPPHFCDGRPHVFYADVAQKTVDSIPYVDIAHSIMTPWEHIRTSFKHAGYASVSKLASYRYESLRASVGHVTSVSDAKNLHRAHDVIVEGYEKRNKFPVLELPQVTEQDVSPDVSIIIPVFNQFSLTYHCMASLILAANRVSFEVVLVDDCSSDETVEIESIVKNAVVVRNDVNLGFLRSCNKGASVARGKYVVFLNNDTETCSYWLDEMIDVFNRFDQVGVVGSKLIYPDGTLQDAGGIVWDNGKPWNVGKGENASDPQYNYTREVDYLTGAALMVDANVWQKAGGFSEEFAPAYYEDTDLAYKVRDAGYRTFYCPSSTVVHFEGQSNGTDTGSGIKRYQEVNAERFKANWRHAFTGKGHEGQDLHLHKDRNRDFRVLMIDHAFPCQGQDAGSYAAIQEMKLMMELGCKVTFLPHNIAHLGKYTDELQKMGVECIYAPFYTSANIFLEQRCAEFDAVYITRYDVAERVMPAIREYSSAKIIFNNADLHFLREMRAAISQGIEDLSGPMETRDRELAVMQSADAILSYNETEHEIIASHTFQVDNIFKCPWVLKDSKSERSFEDRNGIAFLGGFAHPPNREAIEFFIRSVIPLLRESGHDIPFHIYGSNFPPELSYLAADDVIIEGFVESLDDVFDNCRVFVAPLLSGAGIKGKVLDSIAYAVPSVLSPVAAEATGLMHGVSTLIAQTPEQWAASIVQLYADEQQWTRIREASHELVATEYSAAEGLRRMNKVFEHLGLLQSKNTRIHFNRSGAR